MEGFRPEARQPIHTEEASLLATDQPLSNEIIAKYLDMAFSGTVEGDDIKKVEKLQASSDRDPVVSALLKVLQIVPQIENFAILTSFMKIIRGDLKESPIINVGSDLKLAEAVGLLTKQLDILLNPKHELPRALETTIQAKMAQYKPLGTLFSTLDTITRMRGSISRTIALQSDPIRANALFAYTELQIEKALDDPLVQSNELIKNLFTLHFPHQLRSQFIENIEAQYTSCSEHVLLCGSIQTDDIDSRVHRAIQTLHTRLHYNEANDPAEPSAKRAALRAKGWINAAIVRLRNTGVPQIIEGLARLVPHLVNPDTSPNNPLFSNLEALKVELRPDSEPHLGHPFRNRRSVG